MDYVATRLTDVINNIADEDERKQAKWTLKNALKDLYGMRSHLLRCSQQRKGRMDMVAALKSGEG